MMIYTITNMTAKEKLLKIMEKPLWYDGKINASTARGYKRNLLRGKDISDTKIKEILITLGVKPKQKEKW